jgi:outer membrane murein-binding lipoprotein Lpp
MKRRLTTILPAVILTLGMLAGCASNAALNLNEANGAKALSSRQTKGSESEADAMYQRLVGLNESDVVLIVDGQEATAGYFCYWINYIIKNYFGDEIDWTQEANGQIITDYIKNVVKDVVATQLIAERVARSKGIQLTYEDLANIETEIDYYINHYGQVAFSEAVENGIINESDFTSEEKEEWIKNAGEKKFKDVLTSMATTLQGYREVCKGELYSKYLVDLLFYNGGALEPTAEDIEAYIRQNSIFCAKQIFISAVDQEGNPLPENEKENALERAERLLEQIKSSEDPLATFDSLMNEFSEDQGLSAYPNGYVYTKGSMIDEFENAVEALDEGEISDIVESQYGYHIILRLSADNDNTRASYIQTCYENLLSNWLIAAVIEETEAFASIDIQKFCEELASIQAELKLES